jgi:CubicO group peptidase (beta-lactamase class C family)
MTPAGFLISSAEDMAHFLIAQLNGGTYGDARLLSPEGIVALHSPGAQIGPLSAYGMGWVIQGETGSRKVWHNGETSNFQSNLLLLPEQQIGMVVLINVSGFNNSAAINIPIDGVAEILLGDSLSARSNSPTNVMPQVTLLAVLLLPVFWILWSYFSIRRWRQRGELPP